MNILVIILTVFTFTFPAWAVGEDSLSSRYLKTWENIKTRSIPYTIEFEKDGTIKFEAEPSFYEDNYKDMDQEYKFIKKGEHVVYIMTHNIYTDGVRLKSLEIIEPEEFLDTRAIVIKDYSCDEITPEKWHNFDRERIGLIISYGLADEEDHCMNNYSEWSYGEKLFFDYIGLFYDIRRFKDYLVFSLFR